MFEITEEEIEKLNDTNLRILVGRLVEADLSRQNKDLRGVLYGGNQDAPDGGIDVSVEVHSDTEIDSFIPKKITGYQVKKPDMNPASINKEMKPQGKLRPIISEIAQKGGAYIIVCSSGTVTDAGIKKRIEAMNMAMLECDYKDNIYLDFFDRNRLATWIRMYPSVVVWLKGIIGKQSQGWKAYEDWSSNPLDINSEYFISNEPCMYSVSQKNQMLTLVEGINRIRKNLQNEKACVRLAGMSGVGKTRLLQVLFDERIGELPLNKLGVVYCDIGTNPQPMPLHFAEELVAQSKKVIFVVDNCSPEEHKQLSVVCRKESSKISLITVEYDVSEDLPKETEAFYLEPSSEDSIKSVIRAHKSYISENDLMVITKFADGNFRIALALSDTVNEGENVSGLNDEELFQRLFYQRHTKDETLLDIAAVLSLVYSFDSSYDGEEIKLLSQVLDISKNRIYQAIGELERRRLIQSRGKWKAVLPHALSNKLAKRALKTYPKEMLLNYFMDFYSCRMAYSFVHRLSMLHDCEEAIEIVNSYIDKAVENEEIFKQYGYFGKCINYFAPLAPSKILDVIELVLKKDGCDEILFSYQTNYISIIRAIGYERVFFNRTCNILVMMSLLDNNNSPKASDALTRTGNIIWSGTKANISDKMNVVKNLINSSDAKENSLGIQLMGCMIKTSGFDPNFGYEFGALKRDYNIRPNADEANLYFKTALEYAVEVINTRPKLSYDIKSMLADRISEFVTEKSLFDIFEKSVRKLLSTTSWTEGWVACLHTARVKKKRISSVVMEKLNSLIHDISPKTLEEEVRVFALSPRWGYRDYEEYLDLVGESDSSLKIDNYVIQLGVKLVKDIILFNKLIDECFMVKCESRVNALGKGLAIGSKDPKILWNTLIENYRSISKENRNSDLLNGYIYELSNCDNSFCSKILDELVLSEELCNEYIGFQASIQNAGNYHERLMKSLEKENVKLHYYERFAYSWIRLYENQDIFIELLSKIASMENSDLVVIHMIQVKLFFLKEEHLNADKMHSYCMRYFCELNINKALINNDNIMYDVCEILESSFESKNDFCEYAEKICCKIKEAIITNNIWGQGVSTFICSIVKYYPLKVLAIFLPDEELLENKIIEALGNRCSFYTNVLADIADDVLLKWARTNCAIRYEKVSKLIVPYENNTEINWTPLAKKILEETTKPIEILENYYYSFIPNSWSGSKAEVMKPFLTLIEILYEYSNSEVVEWAKDKYKEFIERIREISEWEEKTEKERTERFE